MKIHFIAIGGSAMHNLAIALHLKGYEITGSDDEIFNPAKGRLEKYGLLPDSIGWNPDKITPELDAVILGMHAREDNPELLKAKNLGIKVFSYPEFLYEQSKDKMRIVVGGSHGKTTITAMILHVLQYHHVDCDYMVGAQLDGFEVMVRLTEQAPVMVMEGDEYLTSPIDRRSKFHLYQPNVGIISGIAWDHINVFPTFDMYVEQFRIFAKMIDKTFIYCEEDENVRKIGEELASCVHTEPYGIHPYVIRDGVCWLQTAQGEIPLRIFGQHNMMNLNAARLACREVGVSDEQFYEAIQTFHGASKRLELVQKNEKGIVYKDFAHSPSKLKATLNAVREQYPDYHLVACMELHTFSSLSKEFLVQYKHVMDAADVAMIFFDHKAVAHKKLPPITPEMVFEAFGRSDLRIFNETEHLVESLKEIKPDKTVYLLMSSGNFGGIVFEDLANQLLG
ncbi:MAG: peptidoglycan synthetase [Bacteroidales bacterium]|nr:peptidoglycan synthetase [Bacteroidales bacterium]